MSPVERAIRRETGYGDISRPKPKRRMKKSDRTKAVEYADKWFSLFIRQRDRRCVTCGAPSILECSHLYGKGASSDAVRWNVNNAAAQCKGCHYKHHRITNRPLTDYIRGKIGQEETDALWAAAQGAAKFSPETIRAFGDSFHAKCKEMEL